METSKDNSMYQRVKPLAVPHTQDTVLISGCTPASKGAEELMGIHGTQLPFGT